MDYFVKQIIVRKDKLPDPFWCLESNSAVDSNYITPQAVAVMSEIEAETGLFRQLINRTDPKEEVHALAKDIAAAIYFTQLAASMGLGIYWREDGT